MEIALIIAKVIAFVLSHKAAIFFFCAIAAIVYFWVDAARQSKSIVQRQADIDAAWKANHFRPTFADARLQVMAGNDPFRHNHYN